MIVTCSADHRVGSNTAIKRVSTVTTDEGVITSLTIKTA